MTTPGGDDLLLRVRTRDEASATLRRIREEIADTGGTAQQMGQQFARGGEAGQKGVKLIEGGIRSIAFEMIGFNSQISRVVHGLGLLGLGSTAVLGVTAAVAGIGAIMSQSGKESEEFAKDVAEVTKALRELGETDIDKVRSLVGTGRGMLRSPEVSGLEAVIEMPRARIKELTGIGVVEQFLADWGLAGSKAQLAMLQLRMAIAKEIREGLELGVQQGLDRLGPKIPRIGLPAGAVIPQPTLAGAAGALRSGQQAIAEMLGITPEELAKRAEPLRGDPKASRRGEQALAALQRQEAFLTDRRKHAIEVIAGLMTKEEQAAVTRSELLSLEQQGLITTEQRIKAEKQLQDALQETSRNTQVLAAHLISSLGDVMIGLMEAARGGSKGGLLSGIGGLLGVLGALPGAQGLLVPGALLSVAGRGISAFERNRDPVAVRVTDIEGRAAAVFRGLTPPIPSVILQVVGVDGRVLFEQATTVGRQNAEKDRIIRVPYAVMYGFPRGGGG